MALYKDLSCRAYWADFGRGAVGAAYMPKPSEAAETILTLMARVTALESEVTQTKTKARAALQPMETVALRIVNELDAARMTMRAALNE